jgi:hypothetical protein
MADLFKEILPSILYTKKDVIGDDTKDYNAYIINKALSYHNDCVYFANEMNIRWATPKKQQYDFLRLAIRSRKRSFQPWFRKEKQEDLEKIKLFYGISLQKAKETIDLLSEEQLEIIREKTEIGGLGKK